MPKVVPRGQLEKVMIPDTQQEFYMDEEGNAFDLNLNYIGKVEEGDPDEMDSPEDGELPEGEMDSPNDQPAPPDKRPGRNKPHNREDGNPDLHHSN
jgi:hypothetical protein